MDLNHYVWIYGLAEALAVTLVLAVVFGVKWWRLRQERQRLAQTCKLIARAIKEDIEANQYKSTSRPELRNGRIGYLKALFKPFRSGRLDDEDAWREVLESLDQCFDGLRQSTRAATGKQEPVPPAIGAKSPALDTEAAASRATLETNADIDGLMNQYQISLSALNANRQVSADLQNRYVQLEQANEELRAQLGSSETGGPLRQMLDTFEQRNLEFMQIAFSAERNQAILQQELNALEEHIHNLNVTIKNSRKSAHKLLLERDALTEENQRLIEHQQSTDKLVVRLNRNYDALRREYTKLYEGSR